MASKKRFAVDYNQIYNECNTLIGIDHQIHYLEKIKIEIVKYINLELNKLFSKFDSDTKNIINERISKTTDVYFIQICKNENILNTYNFLKDVLSFIMNTPLYNMNSEDFFNSDRVQFSLKESIGIQFDFKYSRGLMNFIRKIDGEILLHKYIAELLIVKKAVKLYLERKEEYNFEGCLDFDLNSATNGKLIVEFSKHITKNTTKLIYLKSIQDGQYIGYDWVADEIIKLENIIKYTNQEESKNIAPPIMSKEKYSNSNLFFKISEIESHLESIEDILQKILYLKNILLKYENIHSTFLEDELYNLIQENGLSKEFQNDIVRYSTHKVKERMVTILLPDRKTFFKDFRDYTKNLITFVNNKIELLELESGIDNPKDAINNKITKKITWLKNKLDFVALFDKLESLGFIAFNKHKDEILKEHFNFLDGEIKNTALKSSRNNLKNKSEVYRESDEMKNILNDIDESS